MDADAKVGTSSTALLIWIMRVTMPVILFVIWYCAQGQSKKHQYSREDLLTVRAALASRREAAPKALQSFRLVEAASTGGGARRDGGPSKRGSGERIPKGDDHPTGGGRGPPRASAEAAQGQRGDGDRDPGSGAADKAQSKRNILSEEERMNLESLMNFVAFNARDQPQRIFLPDDGCPPPPPPPPVPPSATALEVNTKEVDKANREAQMVLRGILNPTLGIKCPEIVHALHKQLMASHIHVLEKTYCLMVETCIASGDIKGASDFLMKMEEAGHCADSSLLDKVMDIYTESRSDDAGRHAGTRPAAGRRGNVWSENDGDDHGD